MAEVDSATQGQIERAESFRRLHQDPKLLVLPNIWDPLGARMLESLGYPAVATASAAVAFSLGYDDGEKIDFETMLETIRRIAASVDVPVSADIEAGADCIYPIGPGDPATLKPILEQVRVPINVYASTAAAPMRELETLGVARLSLGPGMLRASLTTMKRVAQRLLDYDSYESFTKDVLSSDEIRRYL